MALTEMMIQIMVDHSIYASKVGVQVNSRDLPGELLDQNGNAVVVPPPLPFGTFD